jgi:hypothetical protein
MSSGQFSEEMRTQLVAEGVVVTEGVDHVAPLPLAKQKVELGAEGNLRQHRSDQ